MCVVRRSKKVKGSVSVARASHRICAATAQCALLVGLGALLPAFAQPFARGIERSPVRARGLRLGSALRVVKMCSSHALVLRAPAAQARSAVTEGVCALCPAFWTEPLVGILAVGNVTLALGVLLVCTFVAAKAGIFAAAALIACGELITTILGQRLADGEREKQ